MSKFNHFISSLGAIGILAMGSLSTEAATISFSNPGSVTQGNSFGVDLIINGLEAEDLAGFSIDIIYDDALIDFTSYNLGTELTDAVYGQEDLSSGETNSGVVNVGEISWLVDFTGQVDSFSVATLTFDAIGAGLASLSFGYVDLTNANGFALTADIGTDLDIDVTPVPLPASAWLLGSALLGLAGIGRKKQY